MPRSQPEGHAYSGRRARDPGLEPYRIFCRVKYPCLAIYSPQYFEMGSDCGHSPWLAVTCLESSPIVCWSDGREYYAQINMSLRWSGSVANGLEGIHSAAS